MSLRTVAGEPMPPRPATEPEPTGWAVSTYSSTTARRIAARRSYTRSSMAWHSIVPSAIGTFSLACGAPVRWCDPAGVVLRGPPACRRSLSVLADRLVGGQGLPPLGGVVDDGRRVPRRRAARQRPGVGHVRRRHALQLRHPPAHVG